MHHLHKNCARQKIFDKYNFTQKAKDYLRTKTQIEIVFLETKRPVGLTHSGLWQPGSNTVKLNSANDEVAIHEFAHACRVHLFVGFLSPQHRPGVVVHENGILGLRVERLRVARRNEEHAEHGREKCGDQCQVLHKSRSGFGRFRFTEASIDDNSGAFVALRNDALE